MGFYWCKIVVHSVTYFEELLNEKNERERRNEEPKKIRKRVDQIRKDEEKL